MRSTPTRLRRKRGTKLIQRIATMDMESKIFHVLVPKEKNQNQNGSVKQPKKNLPGYVLVEMIIG